jgi:hypothetical protein
MTDKRLIDWETLCSNCRENNDGACGNQMIADGFKKPMSCYPVSQEKCPIWAQLETPEDWRAKYFELKEKFEKYENDCAWNEGGIRW